jgi:hypothetical protein
MIFGNKTNENWYPYEDMGSYYKLENGVLLFAPMLENGEIDESNGFINDGEVDWNLLEGEYVTPEKLITDRLTEIGYELSVKI